MLCQARLVYSAMIYRVGLKQEGKGSQLALRLAIGTRLAVAS